MVNNHNCSQIKFFISHNCATLAWILSYTNSNCPSKFYQNLQVAMCQFHCKFVHFNIFIAFSLQKNKYRSYWIAVLLFIHTVHIHRNHTVILNLGLHHNFLWIRITNKQFFVHESKSCGLKLKAFKKIWRQWLTAWEDGTSLFHTSRITMCLIFVRDKPHSASPLDDVLDNVRSFLHTELPAGGKYELSEAIF